jgi:environmental stress-induced protein Ves
MHRLLAPADYRRMPWKNAGGHTTEIAAAPPNATLDTFDWRVSIADVERDGAFSRFPGVERTITLLSGDGMRLGIDDREIELRAPFEPYTFDGACEVRCALIAGPVRDFNLMVRRDRAHGVVTIVRDEGARIAGARVRIVYAHCGGIEVLLPAHPPVALGVDHALAIEADEGTGADIVVNPLEPDAVALIASVDTIE